MVTWASTLQEAAWRGIPFHVLENESARGRAQVVHDYPFRDQPKVEDMGRAPRRYRFRGFLIGSTATAYRMAFDRAAEKGDSGYLIHPSLGFCEAAILRYHVIERWDRGRYFEILLEFVETTSSIIGTIVQAASAAISVLSAGSFSAVLSDLTLGYSRLVQPNRVARKSAHAITRPWTAAATLASEDASLVTHAASGLNDGQSYGRYADGNVSARLPRDATVGSQIQTVTADRATVTEAIQTVGSASDNAFPDNLGLLADAIFALTEAIRALAQDPADQVRLLIRLGELDALEDSALKTLIAATVRRCCAISLVSACASYNPTSYDDAMAVRRRVALVMDGVIVEAADLGHDATYGTLKQLRATIMEDLSSRGGQLARLKTVTTQAPMPALTLAYSLYQDASREDDLIARGDPWHPAFMPLTFKALSY